MSTNSDMKLENLTFDELKLKFDESQLNKWENYLKFIKDPKNYNGTSQTISIGNFLFLRNMLICLKICLNMKN